MQQRYLELLRRLSKLSATWPACAQIDDSPNGKLPRVNLSVKLSSLCARFDPLDPSTEVDRARAAALAVSRSGEARRGGDRRHGTDTLSKI